MKPLLAFVGGFGLSLAIFVSGIVTAVVFLHADPVEVRRPGADLATLWSLEPRTVTRPEQAVATVASGPKEDLEERLPVRVASTDDASGIDAMETSALPEGDDPALRRPDPRAMEIAHLEWCASRFRSYSPEDDSYVTYGGARERCVSPYSDDASGFGAREIVGEGEDVSGEVLSVQYADGGSLSQDHIEYCFSRYRSYRPADNSYQPYGGGPRQQCR